VLHNPVFYF